MSGFRLAARTAIAAVLMLVLFSSVAAKAQGVCNFLSGAQKTACHNAAVAAANKKAADAEKAKAAANQPGAGATSATSVVNTGAGDGMATGSGGALVPVAQQTAAAQSQTCKGLQVTLVSLARTGPGDITASYLLRNTTNDDMATFVYYGGANGRNTFLIDDTGMEWPKKRGVDGNGNHRQPLIAGANTKYQLIFHVSSGGQDAKTFQVITYFQLLPLSGMGEIGWCNIKFPNVPLSAPTEAENDAPQGQPAGSPQDVNVQRSASVASSQANKPVPAKGPVTASTARTTAAVPANPDVYDSKSFSGLSTWLDAFQKEANNPKEFAENTAKMRAAANGSGAKANTLINGAERNSLQKFLTDHELYIGYYRSASVLVEREKQCMVQRDYTAAEACDCVAGFPGDTTIGPGAGELVLQSNTTRAIAACGRAADLATDPRLKARFTAQRARAQGNTNDPALATKLADEAITDGYHRAVIVKASAALHSVEFASGGFPVPKDFINGELQYGVDALKASKKAGVWETHIVAEQFQEALNNLAFSEAVLEPVVKAMLAPPASSPCRPDSQGDDGKPMAGSGCAGHDFSR
jgi:hypothetical protein